MSRKVTCLVSLVMMMGVASGTSADMVVHWTFDEASGSTITDSIGGVVGSLINTTWTEGLTPTRGSALEFNGSDAYVDVVGQDWGLFKQVSIALWFKFDSLPRSYNQLLGESEDWTSAGCIHLLVLSDGRVGLSVRGTGNDFDFNSTTTVQPGVTYHVVATFDTITDRMQIYINGILDSEATSSLSLTGIFLRSPFTIGSWNASRYWDGVLDDLRIYDHVLTKDEIVEVMKAVVVPPVLAAHPNPVDKATDVRREVLLSWTAGEFAATHDVYLGTVFDDVNSASRTNPRGVLASQNQITTTYDPPGRLDLGQTYYWRIDEANAPPDSTVFKGSVWSFTVEPRAYPITNIVATASSTNKATEGPENTINDSGVDDNGLHSTEPTHMWLSSITGPQPTWIQYEFDRIYKLHQMQVWNYNTSVEPVVGFGIKEATVEYSADGANWATLGTTHEFGRGPGADGYAPNAAVDLGGVAAKYVKITANSNWGGIVNQYGLSEVRFLYIPVFAREPDPVSGATDVGVDTALSWRVGREAAKHDVYLSTDEQAVIDGTTPAITITSPNYASSLNLATTYYWRIDEVNEAETPTTWTGEVWSLSTQEYLVVDDFESYNDIEAGQEGSHLVYETWADGFGTPTNGSTVGYTEAFQPSMETATVYDGKQSVPLLYNNTATALSEVTVNVASLQAGKDWTKYGIKGLTLRFFGDPNNAAQQMYVKVNSAKVIYDGDAQNLKQPRWQMWYIDLASLGVNLGNVNTLTIGFERIGSLGGQGKVLLDGFRLYSRDRQLITPVNPGTTGLQARYQFEGNANDSSGHGRNGTTQGEPAFAAGQVGQAISLDGLNDYVTITGYKGILADASGVQQPCTVTAWVKTTDSGDRTIASWGTNTSRLRVDFRLAASKLRVEHGAGNVQADTTLNDGNWHHVALTMIPGATVSYPDVTLWLDGKDDTRASTDPDAFSITAGVDMAIGYRATAAARYFFGAIDDVYLYDRVLSREEICWLAGQTMPFDNPF